MGIGGEAQPQQTQSAVQPHQGLPSVSLFLSFISLFFIQNSVRRRTCRTHDATAREGQRLRRTLRWSPLRALNLLNTPFRGLPLEGDAFNSSNPLLSALFVSFRTHSSSSRIKMQHFLPIIALPYIYICSFTTCCIRTFWYGQIHQGLMFPALWCDKV